MWRNVMSTCLITEVKQSTTQKRPILVDFKEFKTFYVALCVNFVNSAM